MHSSESVPGRGNHLWKPIYKSEIKSSTNASPPFSFEFNNFSILIADMCGEDLEKEIKVEFFRSQKNGRHVNIGQVLFCVNEIKDQNVESLEFGLTKSSALLKFDDCRVSKRHSFLEYIFGGCELNLAIAVDFTLSNGNPSESDSLHTYNMQRNQYHKALQSVGQILQYYDTDKQFPVFGFGSKLRTNLSQGNSATHCFALNGNIFDPEVDGLEGVLEVYKKGV